MDMTTEVRALFGNDPRYKGKALLVDITLINPFVSINLEIAGLETRNHLIDAVVLKKNKYQGLLPAIYYSLPLCMSMFGELGPEVHALIKELALRPVNESSEIISERSWRFTEGTELARLRERFSSVARLSTRCRLCKQGPA